jgi:SPP1 gp7 family putative phage head morphogenesis protein
MPEPIHVAAFLAVGFDQPPARAAAYLSKKLPRVTWSWDELAADAHHRAFTVAKIAQADLLATMQKELLKAQAAGTNFREFQKNLEPLLKARGWWGKVQQVNPKTGQTETVLAGAPYRLENIYRTNLQSSYQAGRKAQMEKMAARRPYWQYLAITDSRTRPAHLLINGIILPADHPFWQNNFPPNGYQCRCRTKSLSERQLAAAGGPAVLAKGLIQIQGWQPDAGFASDPLDVFKPDLTRYPARIAQALDAALDAAPPQKPVGVTEPGLDQPDDALLAAMEHYNMTPKKLAEWQKKAAKGDKQAQGVLDTLRETADQIRGTAKPLPLIDPKAMPKLAAPAKPKPAPKPAPVPKPPAPMPVATPAPPAKPATAKAPAGGLDSAHEKAMAQLGITKAKLKALQKQFAGGDAGAGATLRLLESTANTLRGSAAPLPSLLPAAKPAKLGRKLSAAEQKAMAQRLVNSGERDLAPASKFDSQHWGASYNDITTGGPPPRDKRLSQEEQTSILHYTRKYEDFNRKLRLGQVGKDYEDFRDLLNLALDKLPAYDKTVYRGLTLSDDIIQGDYSPGSVVEWKAFSSTTTNAKVASENFQGNVFMEIRNSGGRDVAHTSHYGDEEAEVLMKAGSRVRVISRELVAMGGQKVWRIVLEGA